MKIPLLDLARQYPTMKEELHREWSRVLETMKLLNGDNMAAFEKEIAAYLGARHAFGMASGSDALLLGLIACGIGEGAEVILHANAFVAAVEAIRWAGAKPVLVDMQEKDFGPAPDQIEKMITKKTKAIMVVHMYGHPVDLEPAVEICQKKGLLLIEDCSHAHGAEYQGKKVGTFGAVGCFSCGPVKNLNAFGDAGFSITDNSAIAEKLNLLRVHGQKEKNQHNFYGFNSRLDELQAIVLRIKLRDLDKDNKRRGEIARRYAEAFATVNGITPPPLDKDKESVYHRYVIRSPKRDALMQYLQAQGVGVGIQYSTPLHKQIAWKQNGYGDYHLPVAERVATEILSIPMYPELQEEEIEYVIAKVKEFSSQRP
ncbi:MAG: DegT/DnrJ/EryC1/StrS family aminotransferase [Deltaproteobacteria bacterium]|nr:DegT/DnrJ/EryC1/StrS family aminotransferase [Deltaproteobacteria bacterium]